MTRSTSNKRKPESKKPSPQRKAPRTEPAPAAAKPSGRRSSRRTAEAPVPLEYEADDEQGGEEELGEDEIEGERRVCVLCELIASGFRFEASAVSQLQTRSDHTHSKQLLPVQRP